MKKALLIFLMLVLPWQSLAAMERTLAHISGGRGHEANFVAKHLAEHAQHVLHHHDDDADDANNANDSGTSTHVDNSAKSVQHLADYEHAASMHILLPNLSLPRPVAIERIQPAFGRDLFGTRSILPLLRPPRLPA